VTKPLREKNRLTGSRRRFSSGTTRARGFRHSCKYNLSEYTNAYTAIRAVPAIRIHGRSSMTARISRKKVLANTAGDM
jgi:hypothetical protein